MAGKIQNEDLKTQAELIGAGGAKSQLPNSAKVYLESYQEAKTLKEAMDERLLHGTPLEIHQAYPADSKIYFEPSTINTIEGKGRTVPPIKSQIPVVPASTVDFQTGATTGASFDMTFPASTIGLFRRVGFSLFSNGLIKAIFSDEAASVGALVNPGTLFVKGALPIGYLDLEVTGATAFKTAGSATNVIEHKVGGSYRVVTFGSGGGGSGGSGDTTDFEQSLQRRLEDAISFEWVTPNIFSVQEDTLIDDTPTTAIYDIANSEYDFTGVQVLLSIQQYGARFLAEDRDSKQIELHALWDTEDDAATYEICQDGSALTPTFEAITMERVGDSKKWRGIVVLTEPAGTIQAEYPVSNAVAAIAELNASTRLSYAIKMPAVPVDTKKRVQSGTVYINKVGLPVGELIVKLVPDNGGSPDTTLLGTNVEMIDIAALTAGNNAVAIDIPAIVTAQSWWLVFETSQGYKDDFITLSKAIGVRVDITTPSYSEGDSYQYDGASWTTHAGNQAVFELVGFNFDLRVRITSSQNSSLFGYGIFYGEYAPTTYNQELPLERFDIDGDANVTSITLTKFLPNITCKVYYVNTGQVLRWPTFAINGRDLVFANNQFLLPGETVILLVDQSEQGIFDVSDANANLLASNHLGSTDLSTSRAMPGRGVILMRPDGTLRELAIDDSDNITINTVP